MRSYGEWAIVTGATDGIGRCYADELAKLKFNILLISRTESKLKKVCKEIEGKYGVDTKYIVFDFSVENGDYEMVRKMVEPLDVGVLVNNVGMSGQWDQLYDQCHVDEHLKIMRTNTFGEIHMTHILTRKMVQQKRGYIIHVSSFFGFLPSLGLISVYAPTKAFVNAFVENLRAETRSCENVHHQLVNPFFVVTNMTSNVVKTSLITPDASSYVASAMRTVGVAPQTFGYWVHDLIGSFILTFPTCMFTLLPFCKAFNRKCKSLRLKMDEKKE